MKKNHLAPLMFVLLALSACNKQPPINPVSENETPYVWKAPATLTGNPEQDLQTLATFTDLPFDPEAAKKSSVVILPANSTDGLAAAVQAAGPNGIVVVKSGDHYETGSVVISQRINIIGESGAVIHSGVQNVLNVPYLEPAIHLLNAGKSVVAGLQFSPTAGPQDGGTVFLVENSDQVHIALNQMTGFEFGIVLEQSEKNWLTGNHIVSSNLWQTVGIECHGIIIINGEKAKVRYNNISGSFFGVWACDGQGLYKDNYTHDNYLGLILCKVPANAIPLPGGQAVGAQFSANHWTVTKNYSNDNLNVGYLVIDGANNNTLTNNQASGNGDYDIELVGDSYRFGFLTPFSFDNTVNDAGANLKIKDCGTNNTVNGGVIVDIVADPCY
ncbi:MAG: NosD domain-containing protein [Bacteroidia bacterium]